jgi:hypothetical protein
MTQLADAPAAPAATAPAAAPPPPAAPTAGAAGKEIPAEASHQDRVATLHAALAEEDNKGPKVGDEPAKTEPEAKADEAKVEASPKLDKDGKPVVEKPEETKDPKLAAKFAAIASERKDVVERRAQLESATRAHVAREQEFTAQKAQFAQQQSAREQEFAAREARIRAAEESDHKLMSDSPEKIFQRLIALGVDSDEKLAALGKREWGAHRARAEAEKSKADAAKPKEPDDPKAKPLTIAEWEKLQAEAAKKSLVDTQVKAEAEDFEKGFDETKHEAASTIFTREDRYQQALKITQGWKANGKAGPYSADDIREAVNTLAELDPRWHKVQKRGPLASAASTKAPTGSPDNKAADSAAPQSPRGNKTLSNDAVSESSPAVTDDKKPQTLNGAGSSYKSERQKRLANMMRS